jgi:uncharacterized protein (DUF58 family)
MESARDILKKIRHIELKTRKLVSTAFAGQYRSVFKGRGMNFEEVREYQAGDEVRAIDWNVTARMGHPFIKKFTEERELTVMLIVDVSASGNFGSVNLSKRELAAEVACLLAFSAIRNNDKVGLILFSDHVEHFIPPRKGSSHTLRLIRDILFFEPQGRGTDPTIALAYLNRVVTRKSVAFLISDFEAPKDFSREISITARRHDLIAMPISDPRENELPDVGIVTFEDAETGELIEINTSNRSVRKRHAQSMEKRRASLNTLLRKQRIDSIQLSTAEFDNERNQWVAADYLPALRTFFRTRERRLAMQ